MLKYNAKGGRIWTEIELYMKEGMSKSQKQDDQDLLVNVHIIDVRTVVTLHVSQTQKEKEELLQCS